MNKPGRSPWLSAPARLTLIWGAIVAALIVLYFLAWRAGDIGTLFAVSTNLGPLGMVGGVVMMALFSVIPVPSEFVSILLMHAYGPLLGTFLSWTGGVVGDAGGLWLARSLFRPLAYRIGAKYLRVVEPWLNERGTGGLLAVRFVPLVPYHVVNYLAGVLDVPIWPFILTTALGTLPFQVGLAGLYSGFAYGSTLALVIGGGFLAVLVVAGAVARRRLMPDSGDGSPDAEEAHSGR